MKTLLKSLEARLRASWLFGAKFRRYLEFLNHSQNWSADQLRHYQHQQFQSLLHFALRTVPYYQQRQSAYRSPQVEDLPLLTKAELRQHNPEFVSRKFWRPLLIKAFTSGTTGTPLKLWRSWDSVIRENAFLIRHWQWGGYTPGAPRVFLRGDMPVPAHQSRPPFWKFIPPLNMLVMSSYHLSPQNIPHYIDKLREFRPHLIQAYPSSIYLLAHYVLEHGITDLRVPLIVTSSETLLDYQRTAIVQAFSCRLFDHYGNAERNVLIGTCEHGNYHIFSDYALVELLPTANPDEFELVGTGFINHAMPLIRYCTGDTVVVDAECSQPCPCGRHFPRIKSIIGRIEDYLVLPDGRKIGRLDHIFKGLGHIVESQIIQNADYSVVIKVVTAPGYSPRIEQALLANFRQRVGQELPLRLEYVSSIPRTAQGKFRAVISHVKPY